MGVRYELNHGTGIDPLYLEATNERRKTYIKLHIKKRGTRNFSSLFFSKAIQ